MPARNGIHVTQAAIKSVLSQDVGGAMRVLLMDNATTDGTYEWARARYPNVITLRHDPPLSVAESWNKGLGILFENTGVEEVLVCNNDIVLRPDTYRRLLLDGGSFVTAVGVNKQEDMRRQGFVELIGFEDKVKIGKFLEMGINLHGVVHVGTNDGYEIQWYQKLGLDVMGFEPLLRAYLECCEHYPDAIMHNCALGSEHYTATLHKAGGDGAGSTFLHCLTDEKFIADQEATVKPLTYFKVDRNFDCLVVDTQGMELSVLKGAEPILHQFKCLNIECSRTPIYAGEAPAQEVVDWLAERGFTAITPIEDHNDILFVRDDVLGRRPHPDFSCYLIRKEVWERVGKFDEGYKMAFCEDNDYHVRLHMAGVDAHSIDLPFYHVGSNTINTLPTAEREELCKAADANREYFKSKWGFGIGTPEYSNFFTAPTAGGV
jgi:FkbM family methyltransferase